jgi:RHH-type transcriptional regulator, rel operon repressor / antitoxin RelB
MITLRLDEKLEQQITTAAKNLGVTKSELIRKSIHQYLRNLNKPSAWDLGEDVFGKYASGLGNLSSDRKELMRNKIKAKRT